MLRLNATAHAHAFAEAATALATDLARLLGAQRACVGFVDTHYAEVVAVSGLLDFEAKAEIFRIIAAAMDEAIEQGATLIHPAAHDRKPRVTIAQAELARQGAGGVCTIPLVSNQRAIGAIALEFAPAAMPAAERITWCEDLACMLAPSLQLRRHAEMGWWRRQRFGWRTRTPDDERSGRIVMSLAACSGIAALTAVLAWPVQYRVSAPARLEGAIQRALVAPADGYLQRAHVKPGDMVREGQVLAELADQELELERRKWASENSQNENTSRAALARGERTQYVMALGKAAEAQAQLQLVEQQMLRGRIRAPFDGVVIKGDLSQSLGAPVQRGDVLLTVAPAQQFRLMIEVDERDIGDIRQGATGVVALAALPGETVPFTVVRMTPVATSREGRNYYEVEARLEAAGTGMRPGLQGVGKILAEDRSLAWIWGHRLLDWARLAIWSLGG